MKIIIQTIIISTILFNSIQLVNAVDIVNIYKRDTVIENAPTEDMINIVERAPVDGDDVTYPSIDTFIRCKIEASGFDLYNEMTKLL